ncbi:MAG: hypothetical protein IT363_05875 [Methanoregulaceae archaeon]|nr:hypothetical protein [Methanoregulaceae archaeon]
MNERRRVSKVGLAFAVAVLTVGGILLGSYVNRVQGATQSVDQVSGESAGTILFFGVLPIVGLGVLAYLAGTKIDSSQ